MSRYRHFAPYVPVAQRRKQAAAHIKKLIGKGKSVSPIIISGRAIATTFWGKAWCDNLEAWSDEENRLPRGRTYARNGSIIDLQITGGKVTALVQGSSLYQVTVSINRPDGPTWRQFKQRCAGRIASLLDLLQGRLDKGVLSEITRRPGGLFPERSEIRFSCSCPDGAFMCKHVAATLYGVGSRLDSSPELFFTLRSADMQELVSAAGAGAAAASATAAAGDLADEDLSALFGIEMEGPVAAGRTGGTPRKAAPKKNARSKAPRAPQTGSKKASPARASGRSRKTAKASAARATAPRPTGRKAVPKQTAAAAPLKRTTAKAAARKAARRQAGTRA